MDKIANAFKGKKANIGYIVAGYPSLEYSKEFLNLLDDSVLDIIEIGIPYSDPLADGKLIANAAFQACNNGVNTTKVFDMLNRKRCSPYRFQHIQALSYNRLHCNLPLQVLYMLTG